MTNNSFKCDKNNHRNRRIIGQIQHNYLFLYILDLLPYARRLKPAPGAAMYAPRIKSSTASTLFSHPRSDISALRSGSTKDITKIAVFSISAAASESHMFLRPRMRAITAPPQNAPMDCTIKATFPTLLAGSAVVTRIGQVIAIINSPTKIAVTTPAIIATDALPAMLFLVFLPLSAA